MTRTLSIAVGVFIGVMAVIVAIVLMSLPSSGWTSAETRDPMTDAVTYHANLFSDDGRAEIELACQPGEPVHLYVKAPVRLGGYTDETAHVERTVDYRFDQEKVQETLGLFGSDIIGFRGGAADTQWDADIIARMARAQRLAIEVESARGDKVSMTFDLDGASEALRQLKADCAKT